MMNIIEEENVEMNIRIIIEFVSTRPIPTCPTSLS